MVFDKLGPSLFDFIKRNHYRGFPAVHVQSYARQILESVAFMANLKLVRRLERQEQFSRFSRKFTRGVQTLNQLHHGYLIEVPSFTLVIS